MKKTLMIIGAGASGMFSAFSVAGNQFGYKNNLEIMILDANEAPGKKILMTGNGRCNLCNIDTDESKYYCSDLQFVKNTLDRFGPDDVITAFQQLGITLKNKNGYIYPASMQALTVSRTLISALRILGVTLINNCKVQSISVTQDSTFCLDVSENDKRKQYKADYVIVSCGSNAGLKTNAARELIESLIDLGHTYHPMIPALCSLYADQSDACYKEFFKKVSGVRTEIKATLNNHAHTFSSVGELQITDYGLSGIVIFQISHIASQFINRQKKSCVHLSIDFLPESDPYEMLEFLKSQIGYHKKSLLDLLSGVLNAKLALGLINLYSSICDSDTKPFLKNCTDEQLLKILTFIKNTPFIIKGTNDIYHSQVCSGGIDVSDISKDTLESNRIKHLYFTGEILDVDGICGGYNLQWAWSTGYIAGRSVAGDLAGNIERKSVTNTERGDVKERSATNDSNCSD